MNDLGHICYFLELEVFFDNANYYLSQAKYATKLLPCVGLTNNTIANTQFEDTILDDHTLYRKLVRSII